MTMRRSKLICCILAVTMVMTCFTMPAATLSVGAADDDEYLIVDCTKKSSIQSADFTADSKITNNDKKYSAKWDFSNQGNCVISDIPSDITPYTELKFSVYANADTPCKILIRFMSNDPATEGDDYYSSSISFSHDGWQEISMPLSKFGKAREPLGYDQVTLLEFCGSGWDMANDMDNTVLYFDDIKLVNNENLDPVDNTPSTPTPTPTPPEEMPEEDAGTRRYLDIDFETEEALSKLTINQKDNSIVVDKDKDDNSFLRFVKGGTQDFHVDASVSGTSRYVVMQADFAFNGAGTETQIFTTKDATNAQNNFLMMRSGGNIELPDKQVIGTLSSDWQNIAVAADFGSKIYDVYIDNKLVVEDVPMKNPSIGYVTLLRTWMAPNGTTGDELLVDNLRLFDGKSPDDYENTKQVTMEDILKDLIGKPSDTLPDGSESLALLEGCVAMNVDGGSIYYNGEKKMLDVPAYYKDDRTLIPLRAVSEAFGCTVGWDEATQTASIDTDTKITIGSTQMQLADGSVYTLDVPAETVSDRTFLPLRALAEQALGKKVFWDDRGLIIISDKDLTLSEEDIVNINNNLLYARPKAADFKELFETVNKNQHPRILANAQQFEQVKKNYQENPTVKAWGDTLIKDADKILTQEPAPYEIPDGLRLLETCRSVLNTVHQCAMAYHLTGDMKYVDRVWKEIENAGNFKDWNPQHYLDIGEMTTAFSIAYDWLYDVWTDEQKAFMEKAIYEKSLTIGLQSYYGVSDSAFWWTVAESNWNAVTNGGTSIGAVAIFDKYPDICADILEKSTLASENMLVEFYPDGAWFEGPGYWDYMMKYLGFWIATYDTAFGTDFNMSKAPGLAKSAEYVLHGDGPVGANNFHDAGEAHINAPSMFWFSNKFDIPGVTSARLYNMERYNLTPSAFDLLYYDASIQANEVDLPLDAYFGETELAAMRSSWTDPSATYVSFHSGLNVMNHSHLDTGTFVLDMMGERFACDLGAEDYNIEGYWDSASGRWQYYRTRPEGHNTLVINPDSSYGQDLDADNKFEKFESKERGAFAITQMSDAYKTQASSVRRGIMLGDDRRSVTIRDEMNLLNDDSEVYWFMHTKGAIEIVDDHTAIIDVNGKKVKLSFITNAAEAQISEMKAEPLPDSPQIPAQNKNNGYRKVAIKLKASGETYLAVKIIPLNDIFAEEPLENIALDDWTIPDGSIRELPKLDMIYVDGQPIDDFAAHSRMYSLTRSYGDPVPQITAAASDAYTVEVSQAQTLEESTNIKVIDNSDPRYFEIYSVTHRVIPKPKDVNGLTRYITAKISASDVPQPENSDFNAVDDDIETRWAAEGDQWLLVDLGMVKPIEAVGVMVWKATERNTFYSIELSEDGENWTKIYEGQSSGTKDNEYDFFDAAGHSARYVRLNTSGTDAGTWASILEFAVLGK